MTTGYSDDSRFNLLRSSDEDFLRFLCEMVNPVVRPDHGAVIELLAEFNDALAMDGWEIFESKKISGRPVFAARRMGGEGQRSSPNLLGGRWSIARLKRG